MTKAEIKRGGGKLSRSETVTVRLDPQLRYLVDLAARKQRRTLSSFIEWALEDSLGRILLKDGSEYSEAVSIADEKHSLWDVDESDRFAKLALSYPEMLNHTEQVMWKLIRENGYLWRGHTKNSKWTWVTVESSFCFDRLRENWSKFNDVANGVAEKSVLPTWSDKAQRAAPPPSPVPELDDENPVLSWSWQNHFQNLPGLQCGRWPLASR